MKAQRKALRNRIIKLAWVAAWSLLGLGQARGEFEVSGSVSITARADFDAPLAASGTWIDAGGYGHCWRPAHVSVEWRPYCTGYWTWTDCGWYWNSDEPWAWACYHYGNWVCDADAGWVWVPGIEWAPAWVSWRFGGGFVGWAPLPPPGLFFAHVAAPSLFCFVHADHFEDPVRRSSVIVNNTVIINKTTSINNVRRETRSFAGSGSKRVFVNDGPGLAAIEKVSHHTFATVPIREAAMRTKAPESVVRRSNSEFGRSGQVASGQAQRGVAERQRAPGEQQHAAAEPQHAPAEHHGWFWNRSTENPPRETRTERPVPPARENYSRPEHYFGSPRTTQRQSESSRSRGSERGAERNSNGGRDQGHDHGGKSY